MSQASLKAKIKAAAIAVKGPADDDDTLDEFAEILSTAIVDWFENDAQSKPGSFSTPSGAVTGTGELIG